MININDDGNFELVCAFFNYFDKQELFEFILIECRNGAKVKIRPFSELNNDAASRVCHKPAIECSINIILNYN